MTTVASGNYPFAELQDGAIVFAAQNAATAPTQASVNLAHPAVGLVTLATFTGPINDLVVSPTGEIVWQYTDAGKNWVNGTYFAGVAAPAAGTPAQILATSPYNWIRVRPQVLAGVGPDADPVRSRLRLWIGDLGKNKFFAPGAQVGDTGDIERGVRGRLGTSEYFAVSDDQLKVLYVSQDPTSSVPGGFNYTLWLTDLAAEDVGS